MLLPDLAAVHVDMGWSASQPILHPDHPVVVEATKRQPNLEEGPGFILCPHKATVTSSISDMSVPIFADFRNLIGMFVSVCPIILHWMCVFFLLFSAWVPSYSLQPLCVSCLQSISADSAR